MTWIGLDIGGANIKLASATTQRSFPFELWKHPEGLSDFLGAIVPDVVDRQCAITMTGELADGFSNKQSGVAEIVSSVEKVFPNSVYYQTSGELVEADTAREAWLDTAAANWHAIATWVATTFEIESGVVIDIGSTTTDVIPIEGGLPSSDATTDIQRLEKSRLVYTGVRRSSICGLLGHSLDGKFGTIANEFFATIEDAYLVLGWVPESPDCDTADGRPKSTRCAMQRLARMLCADVSELGTARLLEFATYICMVQGELIVKAIETSLSHFKKQVPVVICGEGEWLSARLLEQVTGKGPVIRLSDSVDQSTADCAGAVAVRELAERKVQDVACR